MIEKLFCPMCSRQLVAHRGNFFCPITHVTDSHCWIETNGCPEFPGDHICGIEYRFENFRAFVDLHEEVTVFWNTPFLANQSNSVDRVAKVLSFEELKRYDRAWILI